MSEPNDVPEPSGSKTFRIVIVGAGIAGTAAAIGLRQAGHEVVLLDRMPAFPSVSSGIHLPPNSCKVLQQLGVLSNVEKHAIPLEYITLCSYVDGSTLRSIPLVPDMLEKYKVPYLATHRAAFHHTLVGEARALGVQIEFGCTVLSIDFEAPSVQLENDRVFNADLVLGSDGELSQCRSLLLGRSDLPNHFGHMLFSCEISQDVLRSHDDLRDLVDSPGVPYWLGPGSLCLGSAIHESGSFNLLGGLVEPMTTKVETHPYISNMEEVKEYHKDWDPKLRKLLDLAPFCLKWTSCTIPDVRYWSHPDCKFTLLGDAAHSMTPYLGQGAAQCLEDAAVLSRLLKHATHREQIPDILTIYEGIRKPRANLLKRRSEEMRDVYCTHDGPVQAERDRQLRDIEPHPGYVIPWMDPDFQRWMYAYDAYEEADAAWQKYQQGKWPGTGGYWKLSQTQ